MESIEDKYPQLNKHRIRKDPRLIKHPSRVKDHPIWHAEKKPWAFPLYPHKGLHVSIEIHYLYRTVLRLGEGNYANLGVFVGASTHSMVHGAVPNNGHVYAVDIFDTDYFRTSSVEEITKTFNDRNIGDYVTFCKGLTKDWAKKLNHLKFKFIFIDADHKYESCLEDFKLWSPLIEEGGEIAFHDVDMEPVNRVITEELDDWELVDHVYRIKGFKRKGE